MRGSCKKKKEKKEGGGEGSVPTTKANQDVPTGFRNDFPHNSLRSPKFVQLVKLPRW